MLRLLLLSILFWARSGAFAPWTQHTAAGPRRADQDTIAPSSSLNNKHHQAQSTNKEIAEATDQDAIAPSSSLNNKHHQAQSTNKEIAEATTTTTCSDEREARDTVDRRRFVLQSLVLSGGGGAATSLLLFDAAPPAFAAPADDETAFLQQYADFTPTPEGWSYREVTPGKAGSVKAVLGDRVLFDWSGYTIGYFGRPFQAKGGPQGGAFDKDVDYLRTVLGTGQMVKGLECAMVGMSAGQVRQVVVPYDDKNLSYPPNDPSHDKVGPKPTTFSGQRALNFVLDNPRVDRTMLFNVKVIRVDKPDGKGGFTRG